MKNPSRPITPPAPCEDDIRAYAEHLYEQSGRLPDRDLENWLEAKACLEANIPRHESHLRLHRHLQRRRPHGAVTHGFTMPPSDACLWIEKNACDESTPASPSDVGEEAGAATQAGDRGVADATTRLPIESAGRDSVD